MAVYVGICREAGKVIETDADALAYAFELCGIEPSEGWNGVNQEFKDMLLEWFYSGDWVKYSHEEWEAVNNAS